MALDEREIAIIRKHKRWANGYSVIWTVLAFAVLAGNYGLLTMLDASDTERVCMMLVAATLVLVNAVWQAAGMALAAMERTLRPSLE
jgi:hypothetical protein